MPLISNVFSYLDTEITLIREIESRDDFNSDCWGIEELQAIRSRIRDHYRDDQNGICPYCKERVASRSAGNAQIEHIISKNEHIRFMFEPKNLCVSCGDCNEYKGSASVTTNSNPKYYPRSSSAFRIVHPHFDEYDDHIVKEGIFYRDLTPKGHFTIGICKLNQRSADYGRDPESLDDQSNHDLVTIFEKHATAEERDMLKRMLLGAINN